jgi:hypothetical protein
MNEVHTLDIRITVEAHKSSRDVSVRLKRYIPFVPREGMRFRFTNEDKQELEVTLGNLVYDYDEKIWIEEQSDVGLAEYLRDSDNPDCTIRREHMDAYLQENYLSHGFEVLL